jgi:hypothetical protein
MCGEIDIMESVNGANRDYGTYHCGTLPGGPCNEPTGLSHNSVCPGSTCQGNFHTYRLLVDRSKSPESLTWFVDGKETGKLLSYSVPPAVWIQTIHKPHFILLNLAMGGAFPNALAGRDTPTAQTVPGGKYQIGYVAVYNT